MNHNRIVMYARIIFFIAVLLLARCKTGQNTFTFEEGNIDKIELEINNFKIPLERTLVDDFIEDFNKNELVHSDKKFTYLLDLLIHTKDGKILYLKSNGSNVFYNNTVTLSSRENLILKYWQIYEENIPLIKAPSPRMN